MYLGTNLTHAGLTLSGNGTVTAGAGYGGLTTLATGYYANEGPGSHLSPGIVGVAYNYGGGVLGSLNGIGTLTTGNETWGGPPSTAVGGSCSYLFDIAAVNGTGLQTPGVGADLLNIHGNLDVSQAVGTGGTFTIKIDGGLGTPSAVTGGDGQAHTYSWDIATITGGTITGSASNLVIDSSTFFADNPGCTGTFSLSQDASDVVLNYTGNLQATPEPGTVVLLLSGAVALAGIAWRRKRAA